MATWRTVKLFISPAFRACTRIQLDRAEGDERGVER
jgi:hypothetical protein